MSPKQKNATSQTPKVEESFGKRLLRWCGKHPLVPTLLAAVLIVTSFYSSIIRDDRSHGRLFLPLNRYMSMQSLPLWNPEVDSGSPAFSDPQWAAQMNLFDSAVYSILVPLAPILPQVGALYLMLNLLVMCGFTLALLRQLGVGTLTAAAAALMLAVQPQVLLDVYAYHWHHVMALALLPVVLYFSHQFMHHRRLLWFVLSVLFFIFQLLRGSAVVSLITIILLAALVMVNSLAKTRRPFDLLLNIGYFIAVLGLGALGAAYVLLPLIDYFRFAHLTSPLPRIQPRDLMLLFYPSFNGGLIQHQSAVFYVSILALFIAGFGLLLRRTLNNIFGGVILLGIAAAGLFKFSLLTAHGFPVLFTLLTALGVTTLQKYHHRSQKQPSRWLDVYMLLILGAAAAGLIILLFNEPWFGRHILSHFSLLTIPRRHTFFLAAVTDSAVVFVLIGIGFILVRLYLRSRISVMLFTLLLFALIFIDHFRLAQRLHFESKQQPSEITGQVERLLTNGTEPFRVFSALEEPLPGLQSVTGDASARLQIYSAFLQETGLNLPDSPWLRNPFFSKYTRLVSRGGQVLEQPIPFQNIDPARLRFDRSILDLLNVRYLLCHSPIHDPAYPVLYEGEVFVYENLTRLSRAFIVDSVYVLPAGRATFDAMREAEFDPRRVVYLEAPPPSAVGGSSDSRATVVLHQPNRIVVETQVTRPAILVLSEIYYPAGWSARVDGRATTIYRANSVMRAVFLPENARRVEFTFVPASFRLGARLSLWVGVLLTVGFCYGLFRLFQSRRGDGAAT